MNGLLALGERPAGGVAVTAISALLSRISGSTQLGFGDYLRDLCDDLAAMSDRSGGPKLTCAAADATLPIGAAITLGLIADLLMNNAFLYARGGARRTAGDPDSDRWDPLHRYHSAAHASCIHIGQPRRERARGRLQTLRSEGRPIFLQRMTICPVPYRKAPQHGRGGVDRWAHATGREPAGPEAEPVPSRKRMSWLEFAGLEARRRPFTVLFHDLGKSSAVWPGRRGLIEVSAARRLVV